MRTDLPQSVADELAARWTAAQPVVSAYISSVVRDFHDSQDILQDVALLVSRNFAQYDPKRSFITWAIAIARNRVRDFWRETSVDRVVFDSETVDAIAAAFEGLEPKFGPVQEALDHCLKRVQGKSLTLVKLRYESGLKASEIAIRVHATVSAVEVALHRIRLALRDCIQNRLRSRGVAT